MLRECPIDHRCMKRIEVDAVLRSVTGHLESPPSMRRAVFLDRDGTLIEESGYLDRLERLVFFPYSVDAVRVLNRAGFLVVIVTNQAGIARGIVKESFVAEAHRHIADRVAGRRRDASTASTTVRTTRPGRSSQYRTVCDCRKPAAGAAAPGRGRSRHRSRAVVRRRRPLARSGGGAGGRRARRAGPHGSGQTGRMGAGSPARRRPPIVDNLMDAAAWILDQA